MKVTQLGRDLADQFAEILAKSGGKFVVVDRTKMLQTLSAAMPPLTTASDLDSGPILEWTHADAGVIGHLEVSEDQISLAAEVRQFKKAKTLAKVSEIFAASKEIAEHLAKVLSVVEYPDSGAIGYGRASCLHCPIPPYPDAAFNARVQGMVLLSVVIEPDGRAYNIVVQKHVRQDLDSYAVRAAESWTFRPAIGPNGNPAAVHMLIEMDFRLH